MIHYLTLHLILFFLFRLKGAFLLLPIITLSGFILRGLLKFSNLLCISDVKSYYEFSFSRLITHFFDSASQYVYIFTPHFHFLVLVLALCVHFYFTAWFYFSVSLCTSRSNL